jgi:phosphonate ABC transporter permease subunit PhnE
MASLPEPTSSQANAIAGLMGRRRFWTILLAAVAIFLLYAYGVQVTEINLEKPLDPARQATVTRVLRLMADPDFVSVDAEAGTIALSDTSIITIERIIETIFMALLASSIGTLLAVPLSFLAARNLMEYVTAPMAAVMAGVISLPLGGWLGLQITRLLSGWAATLNQNGLIGLGALVGVALLVWLILRLGPPVVPVGKRPSTQQSLLSAGRLALVTLLLIFGLALLAGLGLQGGRWLEAQLGPFGFLGNFIYILADFLRLLLPATVSLLGGLTAVGYGSRLGQEMVLRLNGAPPRLLTALLSAAGSGLIVYAIGSALNWLYLFDNPQNWTTIPALIATGVGLVLGVVVAPKRPLSIGFFIYSVTRAILNILRSIEPLIMGIVFVVWVSLGPFAGILALTLHSIAALGKLFSEQVEGIAEGPVEAITATGANRLQTIVYAVIPQIIPPYTAFALYRWDINVRMSTIIGFVGGGGIGFVLSQNIRLLRYQQAAVMMIAIAVVVMTLDYISARIRARII